MSHHQRSGNLVVLYQPQNLVRAARGGERTDAQRIEDVGHETHHRLVPSRQVPHDPAGNRRQPHRQECNRGKRQSDEKNDLHALWELYRKACSALSARRALRASFYSCCASADLQAGTSIPPRGCPPTAPALWSAPSIYRCLPPGTTGHCACWSSPASPPPPLRMRPTFDDCASLPRSASTTCSRSSAAVRTVEAALRARCESRTSPGSSRRPATGVRTN